MDNLYKILKPDDVNCIIYHNPCMDGFGAAFIATKYNSNIKLIPMNVEEEITDLSIIENKNVLMVDIVTKDFKKINDLANKLIILDHHKTNMELLVNIPYAYFDMNKSGVGLAWEYFFNDIEMPLFLECIQDRDLWTWKIPQSREFCDALYELVNIKEIDMTIFDEIYFDDKNFNKYYEIGRLLNKIKMKKIKNISDNNYKKYIVNILNQNLTVYMFNVSHDLASDLGSYIMTNMPDADFCLLWRYSHNDEQYFCSLRSNDNKTDVSKIAQLFGGGGHRNAAGCTFNEHPVKELDAKIISE
jgi:oligoribonuclease NrnB/cAMP/cGMP phosphodiesterase (DHH superfamily)